MPHAAAACAWAVLPPLLVKVERAERCWGVREAAGWVAGRRMSWVSPESRPCHLEGAPEKPSSDCGVSSILVMELQFGCAQLQT